MNLPSDLVYTNDTDPGIYRRRRGKGFSFHYPDGNLVRETREKDRLQALAVPPAYEDVWYCPHPQGHLQATGRDARQRKQYRYHESWQEWRAHEKFANLIEFGEALPSIRNAIDYALTGEKYSRDRIVAALVRLLDKTAARIGNETYYQENGTVGLSTLREKHVESEEGRIQLEYTAKGNEDREFDFHHPTLSKIVSELQDLPGQRLFQYRASGTVYPIDSGHVNEWLREKADLEISAKDFRTWRASELTLSYLVNLKAGTSQSARVRQETEALKATSEHLGHRPPVCRKHYVHPAILKAHREGTLQELLSQKSSEIRGLTVSENQLLTFLRGLT